MRKDRFLTVPSTETRNRRMTASAALNWITTLTGLIAVIAASILAWTGATTAAAAVAAIAGGASLVGSIHIRVNIQRPSRRE